MRKFLNKVLCFAKKDVVLSIASVCMIITCFFVPPDMEYIRYDAATSSLGYFEWKTLVALFCMLTVVAGLKNTYVFELVSRKLISLFRTRRSVIYCLVFGTFFFDMIVANDMSLITFLPLSYIVLHTTGNDKYLAPTFILQTIAANMGGMITPYGNPQNMYLYNFYEIPTLEFLKVLLIQSLAVFAMLFIAGLFIKNEKLQLVNNEQFTVDTKRLIVYAVLFVFVILSIFRVVPHLITLALVVIAVLITDRSRFKDVDYGLLATFCVFFVFSGNMARITVIKDFVQGIVADNTLLAGILSCQFISNVPTAIFLSKFTQNWQDLLVSVNIGSLGIIISSLASLITLKEFLKHQPRGFKKYMGLFTLINTTFLAVLLVITLIF